MTPWYFSFLGYKLALAKPGYLVAMLVALTVGGLAVVSALLRRRRVAQALDPRLHELLAPGISVALPSAQSFFGLGALLCFGVALTQPQCGERAEMVKRRGLDVVVALDASKSMYARDVAPSRLDRAKLELSTLLDALKGDRVAVVTFAGDAFVQCPLTSDYAAAKLFLRAVDPESMPQGGTNIGAALLLAKKVFDSADRGAKDRVVVLLSDGEDITGEVSQGVESLKEIGARVLAVGIGSEGGEPIPIINQRGEIVGNKKDSNGVTVITRMDRAGLQRIAADTDGQLYFEPKGVAMADVVKVIDTLQKAELESRLMMRYGEVFQPLVAAGIVLLLLASFTVSSWRRR
jgi:Ca-activated chloride channel homolog